MSCTYLVGEPRIRPSTSRRSSGLRTGYLGWSDEPACILVRTSSGRVSLLKSRQRGSGDKAILQPYTEGHVMISWLPTPS